MSFTNFQGYSLVETMTIIGVSGVLLSIAVASINQIPPKQFAMGKQKIFSTLHSASALSLAAKSTYKCRVEGKSSSLSCSRDAQAPTLIATMPKSVALRLLNRDFITFHANGEVSPARLELRNKTHSCTFFVSRRGMIRSVCNLSNE